MNTTTPRPDPIALLGRAGKGCQQYTFATIEELQQFTGRKPYSGEQLLVMPMFGRQFLGKQWMPAHEVVEYVRELVAEAREAQETASRLATVLLGQAQRENEECAYWFISALAKLASTQPHMRLPDVLKFAQAAMPRAAAAYASYAAGKG